MGWWLEVKVEQQENQAKSKFYARQAQSCVLAQMNERVLQG